MNSDGLTDPGAATSAAFSRRGFVALGAGAAFAMAGAAAASAQSEGFGKPHPPIVAEDDPAITVATPRLTPKAGTAIGAYAAAPRTITHLTPGIVVTQAAWGVDAQLRDTVRRYAKAGFIAIAPQLYDRVGAPSGDGATDFNAFRDAAAKMTAQGFATTDLLAGHDWIRTLAADASIGITGFCMGGGIALKQIVDSKAYAAASIFYGDVRPGTARDAQTTASTFDYAQRITTPLMGSYGARDTSIKPQDVEALFARLTPPHDVKIYAEAGHAFFDDTRSSYVPAAASDAWMRTLAWFRTYLT